MSTGIGSSSAGIARFCASRNSLVTLICASLAVSTPARAAETPGDELLDEPHELTVYSIRLEPDSENEVVLPALRLDLLSDGRRAIRGAVLSDPKGAHSAFYFAVDPILGTYRTREIPSEFALALAETTRHRAAATLESARTGGDAPVPPDHNIYHDPEDCPTCPDPCSGSWTASVETWDPIFIPLTRTTASGSWFEAMTTCAMRVSGSGTCRAANPSPLGTHWFVDHCGWTSPVSYVNIHATGNFHNWDFGSNSQRTDVTQTVRIELGGVGVSTSFTHIDSGEFSSLLHGAFSQSGTNTCF